MNIDCSMFFNWRTSKFNCILRFTRWTISMSNSIRIWIVFMSWNEYHERKLFVNRSVELSCWHLLLISWFARWESEHDRWIDESDWPKISWDYRASLLDLRETMRWLDVTYSYSGRGRNIKIILYSSFSSCLSISVRSSSLFFLRIKRFDAYACFDHSNYYSYLIYLLNV